MAEYNRKSRIPWFYTLKFRIVAIAVVAAMASAVLTAQLVLTSTEANMRALLLDAERDETESTAAILSTKVDMLRDALEAAARQTPTAHWSDRAAMNQHFEANAALGALFEGVVATAPTGDLISRLSKGKLAPDVLNLGDHAYFQRAMRTDQPVISEPMVARRGNAPVVVMAIAALAPDGKPIGVLAGILALNSINLFSSETGANRQTRARVMVINHDGRLLAHPEPDRLLGPVDSELGLGEAVARWQASGSPIDTVRKTVLKGQVMWQSMAALPAQPMYFEPRTRLVMRQSSRGAIHWPCSEVPMHESTAAMLRAAAA